MVKRPAAAVAAAKSAEPASPIMKRRPAAVPLALRQIELSDAEAKPDWYDEPDDKAHLQNYLVTAAKLLNAEDTVSGPPLRDPSKFSKEEFQEALFDSLSIDSLSNPMFTNNILRMITQIRQPYSLCISQYFRFVQYLQSSRLGFVNLHSWQAQSDRVRGLP